ncbi:Ig heavy chain Mem5-like [Antechinus flavipes]|uniref:Ig heavy chain Mem5-like n=1 Tax=Antechinus flavipes TaxID=38775 RepID=UPI0022366BE1|nr:Ig heavy chain Mem5-like [Antechinus flavipes]
MKHNFPAQNNLGYLEEICNIRVEASLEHMCSNPGVAFEDTFDNGNRNFRNYQLRDRDLTGISGLPLLTLPPSLLHSVEPPLLKESGGGSHQAGSILNLKCETSGFQFKTSKLGWYFWVPGHAPLGLNNLVSSSIDVTEDRITTSREDSGSRIFLQIKDLGLRDSGQYHCVRRVSPVDDTDKLIFGLGTDVTVEPGLGNPLSPSVFLVRSQDAMACLIRNFYPKEIHVSLRSSGTLISAQTHTLGPMANGNYNAIQIGRVGEDDTVTCSVKHFGKEINVSNKPDPKGPDSAIASGKKLSCSDQDLMGPEQGNKLLFDVLVLRLLFIKTVAINVLFSAMALMF